MVHIKGQTFFFIRFPFTEYSFQNVLNIFTEKFPKNLTLEVRAQTCSNIVWYEKENSWHGNTPKSKRGNVLVETAEYRLLNCPITGMYLREEKPQLLYVGILLVLCGEQEIEKYSVQFTKFI